MILFFQNSINSDYFAPCLLAQTRLWLGLKNGFSAARFAPCSDRRECCLWQHVNGGAFTSPLRYRNRPPDVSFTSLFLVYVRQVMGGLLFSRGGWRGCRREEGVRCGWGLWLDGGTRGGRGDSSRCAALRWDRCRRRWLGRGGRRGWLRC